MNYSNFRIYYYQYLKLLFIVFTFYFSTIKTSGQSSTYFEGGDICEHGNWNLVFNDEFNGTELDSTKWTRYYPYSFDGSDQCEYCRTSGDNSNQVFLDNNVQVSNGTLKLIAKRESATWYSISREYTSGMIYSKGGNVFMYGKFECRCKIPYGMGFWPAFWLFGGTGTEIDVFEFGCQKPEHHHLGIAKWRNQVKESTDDYSYDGIDFSLDFHVFSVIWDPFFIRFYVDENEKYSIPRFYTIGGTKVDWCCVDYGTYNLQPAYPSGLGNKVNITAGLGIGYDGGPFTDAPDANTILPNQFEIDYIRTYQRDVNDSSDECVISVYPNPASLNVTINLKYIDPTKVEKCLLLNEDAKTIKEIKAVAPVFGFNVQEYSNGIYYLLLKIIDNPVPIGAKIIVLHK